MENFLRCTLSPGQFTGEYAVSGKQSNQEGFSLFVSQDLVEFDNAFPDAYPVEGWLRVKIAERSGTDVLVCLPTRSLEGGQYVRVKSDQLRSVHPQDALP
jgi:hypothetical protein